MEAYAAYYDNNIRIESSSGAVFSVIATYVLTKKGVVYGVSMTKDCYSAEFVRVVDEIGLKYIRGSKYIQAKVGDTYKNVKEDLLNGKYVLFTGTGCQINGLKCFLKSEYNNLICVDVICHGTPSPELWRRYVEYQQKKYGKLIRVNFRCKDKDRIDTGIKENSLYVSKNIDSYMQMFLRNYSLRPSCYDCTAKELKMSDLSIADFWGIEKVAPEMNDNKGVSLLLLRTDNGYKIFKEIICKLKVKKVSYEDGVKENLSEYRSVNRPVQRDCFFNDMKLISFEELESKYATPLKIPIFRQFKNIIKKLLKCGNKKICRTNADYGILYTFEKSQ